MRLVAAAAALPPKSKASVLGALARDKGLALEDRVAALLTASGKRAVRKNVILLDRHGNRSEVDVVFGRWFPRYVECKAYGPDKSVPLEDVTKFEKVLELNGVFAPLALRRALFVTTSTFSPRALTTGMYTVDGTQLAAWERSVYRRLRLWASVKRGVWAVLGGGVCFGGALLLAPHAEAALRGRDIEEGSVLHVLREWNDEVARGWDAGRSAPPLTLTAPWGWAPPPPPLPPTKAPLLPPPATATLQAWWQGVRRAVGMERLPPRLEEEPLAWVGYHAGRGAGTAAHAGGALRELWATRR